MLRGWRNGISITRDLTAWYAVSLALLLACASLFLYHSLKRNLHIENQMVLNDRLQTVVSLLERQNDPLGSMRRRVESEWALRHFEKLYVRVIDRRGEIVAETPNTPGWVKDIAFREAFVVPYQASPKDPVWLLPPSGIPLLVLAMPVALPENPGRWTIFVAMDLSAEQQVLDAYRWRLIATLVIAFLTSIFVGRFIAIRCLRPVNRMASELSRINSSDLSERVLSDVPDELKILARTFNELLDKIAESMARLSQFSADIAHELRTPVNNLRGEIEVALSRARTASEYQDLLGSNLEECRRLKSIIDSLLFLARAENSKTPLQAERVDLRREISDLAEFYGASAADLGIDLRIDVPEGLDFRADRVLLQTAMGNLLSNSLRYTPAGGAIRIQAGRDGGSVTVRVSDTGAGIPPEHLPHVFDRLYRVDQQRTSESRHHFGLGLAIVHGVMRLHRGEADIRSELGKGTEVSLRFPV